MGRKGLFSSAAAGGSLIAASLVLVIGVSAVIGFRGFRSARDVPTGQSVVLKTSGAADREAGAAKPARVVIGGTRRSARPARTRPAARRTRARTRSGSRTRVRAAAPARSGLSSGTRTRRPASAAPASPAAPANPTPEPAPEQKAPPATPVEEVVEDVTGAVDDVTKKPVEKVGDVLLDVRDALP